MEASKLRNGQFNDSKELNYLNEHHSFALNTFSTLATQEDTLRSKIKAKIVNYFKKLFLTDYLQAEQEYQANLVRFLNGLSQSLDKFFWEEIKEENKASYYSLEKRFNLEIKEAVARLEKQISEIQKVQNRNNSEISVLNSVVSGLERIATNLGRITAPIAEESKQVGNKTTPIDYSYFILENRYRGSEEEITKRLSIYPPYFSKATLPILEIGSGRGELQKLFRTNKIKSYGVETDQGMYEVCRAQGYDVQLTDGIQHLLAAKDQSLGGLIAIQVIEHLKFSQLKELIFLASKKVVKGGTIILETIDSSSLLALTQNYFRDPTHVFPLHPDTLKFLVELNQLKVSEIIKLSPYSKEAQLYELETLSYLPPRWNEAIEKINTNFKNLNELLFGYQDYCLVAEVMG